MQDSCRPIARFQDLGWVQMSRIMTSKLSWKGGKGALPLEGSMERVYRATQVRGEICRVFQ